MSWYGCRAAVPWRMVDPAHQVFFAYGSLMRGLRYHAYLAGARYLGLGQTQRRFSLVDLGDYPGMIASGQEIVCGELYGVDGATLKALDVLEEHPHVYTRTPIILRCGRRAETYLLNEESASGSAPIPMERVRGGDWRNHLRTRQNAGRAGNETMKTQP